MLPTSQNAVIPLEPHTDSVNIHSFNAIAGLSQGDLLSPVQTHLQAIASGDDFFARVLGEKANSPAIQAIHSQWAVGDFSTFPKLQVVEAFSTYSETTQTIYLSDALLTNGADDGTFGATGVLIEETFAWSNRLVGADTAGDEVGHQDQEIPWWDEPPISVAFINDFAGNSFETARDITLGFTPTTVTDWVGSTDTFDFYRFSLNQPSMVNFTLNGLTADADLWLYDHQGNVIQGSWNWGTIPESISQSLGAGTYFLLVNQYSGSTFYNLTTTATNSDLAGNSFVNPRDITLGFTPTTFTDWVGSTDTYDFYRFSLHEQSLVNFTLNGLTADADLWLFDYQGNVIQASSNRGTTPESMFRSLDAGTYFLLVNQAIGDTFYNLTAVATNPDLAGNTLNTARNITLGAIPTTFTDWVGSTDTNDYYRFTLPTTSTINLSLTGLSADADLQLLSSTGSVIQNSWNWDTQDEGITSQLSAGTYFIRVYPYGNANTYYNLNVAATELISPPATGFNTTYGYGLVNAGAAVANAIGQTFPFPDVPNLGGNNWGNDLVNAPEAWARGYTGTGVVVAVVDTGVDYNHADLNDNIWRNPGEIAGNGIDDDGNGYIDDVHGWDFINNDNNPLDRNGHGTHVAGTIAAENNGFGVTGVAYNARIMPVQVLGDNGSGSNRAIANGIRYAADNGAQVINLSLGSNLPSSEIYSAIQYATSLGAVVVMAAGNDGDPRPDYPAFYATDFGLSVGAVDMNRNLAWFSNRAGTNSAMRHVVAPGVSIVSTVPNDRYASYNGTSMATPHVAGVVALMLSANPNLTPVQVRDMITSSAVPLA